MRRPLVAVVAVALVATMVAVLSYGTEKGTRSAGSNLLDSGSFTVVVPRGETYCQPSEFVPSGADRIQMTIGSYGRPTPDVELTIRDAEGRQIARHTERGGFPQGVATVGLGTTTKSPTEGATVCLRPTTTKIALGGFQEKARMDYLRPGSESYLGMTGTILHRFGIGKPGWQGGWLLVIAFGLIAAVLALAVRLLLRESREAV